MNQAHEYVYKNPTKNFYIFNGPEGAILYLPKSYFPAEPAVGTKIQLTIAQG